MSQRKVKDAKDLETNELIYFKGHAKATFMSDGRNVEEAINSIDGGGEAPDLSDYATKEELNTKQDKISDLDAIRSGAAKGATSVQSLAGYTKDADLAAVAKSGSYNDLSNKPTIPSAVTEETVSGWGFTKNQGTYVKPSSGIPVSDLNESVQTDIAKGAEAYGYMSQLNTAINGKQDKIADLDAIRSGAALGATALQEHQSLSGYATEDYVMNAINESIIQTLNGKA